jgi:formimidoylglutamate deiminase
MLHYFQFEGMLLQSEWLMPAFVGVDAEGDIRYLSTEAPAGVASTERVNGYAVPGFRNAHSHAFQYAMAGRAERHIAGTQDDFWSWREAMYKCALSMRPDDMEVVAAMAYAEMIRYGYTHVAEFHYLHHDERGNPYPQVAEMGERLVAAAATAGIKITLVPVLYQLGDFGTPSHPQQRRFICNTIDLYDNLLHESARAVGTYTHARLGYGVHSLRAVAAPDVVELVRQGAKEIPFHLHVAEQRREVENAQRHLGMRPVKWVLSNLPTDDRFHLVHCTHLDDEEVVALARSGANVVLCPGTEGNLGDGIFRLSEFARAGGKWSIGTDSHISLNPLEDLRWLDYAQRLVTHRRNTFDNGAHVLLDTAWRAGNSAMGIPPQPDYFAIGMPLDAAVYDAATPLLGSATRDNILPAIIYTADSAAMLGTLVSGKWITLRGHHYLGDGIRTYYDKVVRRLAADG